MSLSLLGVNTVFNWGNSYATPRTYPYVLLLDKTTLKSPTMPGPVAVNKRLNTECYDFLEAPLTKAKPALRKSM